MRIAHVTQATTMGGLRRVMETLARGQAARHEVLVVGPTPPEHPDLQPAWRQVSITGNLDMGGHCRLVRLLHRWDPGVVFLHAGSPGEMASAAALVAAVAPCVVVEHAPHSYPLHRPFLLPAYRCFKQRANAWVTVSNAGREYLQDAWRIPPGVLRVIWNGVDVPSLEQATPDLQKLLGTDPTVVAFGRPDRIKGFDRFVEMAERMAPDHSHVTWLWVGGAHRCRVGAVHVWPWIPSPGWLMRRALCVVVPSREEGLPLVLLEAWATGACVVASAVGGIPEVMQHGRNGLLVDSQDPARWESTVRRVVEDQELRERLGIEGQRTWRATFTAHHMAERYEELIRELAS